MAQDEPDTSSGRGLNHWRCGRLNLKHTSWQWIQSYKLTRVCLYKGLHIIQWKLYSHSSNVSTERLEMLLWTSRLGIVSDWWHWRIGIVSMPSLQRLGLGIISCLIYDTALYS